MRFITSFLLVAHAVQSKANTDCTGAINDWTFKYLGAQGRGCGWVSNFPLTRCHLPDVKDNCKLTCCGIHPSSSPSGSPSDIPSGVPTAAPSSSPSGKPSDIPSEVPSASPTVSPSTSPSTSSPPTPFDPCINALDDWGFKYLGQQGRGCGWVGNKPWERCLLQGVADSCKKSCCYIMPFPSASPSSMPSAPPSISAIPSPKPSAIPSASPSGKPSDIPSNGPTVVPSSMPSASPSAMPSPPPTVFPSISTMPSTAPSAMPSTSTVPSSGPTVGKGKGKGKGKGGIVRNLQNTGKVRVANMQLPEANKNE